MNILGHKNYHKYDDIIDYNQLDRNLYQFTSILVLIVGSLKVFGAGLAGLKHILILRTWMEQASLTNQGMVNKQEDVSCMMA